VPYLGRGFPPAADLPGHFHCESKTSQDHGQARAIIVQVTPGRIARDSRQIGLPQRLLRGQGVRPRLNCQCALRPSIVYGKSRSVASDEHLAIVDCDARRPVFAAGASIQLQAGRLRARSGHLRQQADA